MIKDILVNLSYGTSQDSVSNYAFIGCGNLRRTHHGDRLLSGIGRWR